jgi:nucleoside-diphosphate-sugar epimerase
MIIGSGLLATVMMPVFGHREDSVVYAAGVSNSHCNDSKEFERESNRLMCSLDEYLTANSFIYFSTCSIYDSESCNTSYVLHKLAMEELVRQHAGHIIIRLPQVAGKTTNPHTILNFLHSRIVRSENFVLWKRARRNIIDADDVAKIVVAIITGGLRKITIDVANECDYSLPEIVNIFELILNKPATCELIERGGVYNIDTAFMKPYAVAAGIEFDDGYLERVLRKYYEPKNGI